MKLSILILSIAVSVSVACKTKKATSESSSTEMKQTTEQSSPKTIGKVSHQYRATGCATVVIIKTADNTITLIPKDKLPDNLDVDGIEISFDYHLLKMHNPVGCNAGIPAALTNIKARK